MDFAKATIVEVAASPDTPPKEVGDPVVVQINPASLRLQMASTVDGGKDAARPKVQHQSATSTLSFDLVFDTADEGTTDAPVDVRTRTRQLDRFVLPAMKQAKAVPPRLKFTYGSFAVVGVMTALNQDFDFFSSSGVPLRAKCAVTIKEQRPEFDANRAGPGANTGAGATPPVPPSAGGAPAAPPPGAAPPAPPPDRTGTALAGESAPAFANRMGLDPRAWKAIPGIDDPLHLPAGQQIDFSSALSATPGLGVETPAPTAATDPGPPAAARPDQLPVDGTALAAAGGLTRVLDGVAAANAGAAAAAARAGFTAGPDPAPPPAPARPDPRALGFGFGVPLRPRVAAGQAVTAPLVRTGTTGAGGGDLPPETDDPTVPGWRALPAGRTAGRCPR